MDYADFDAQLAKNKDVPAIVSMNAGDVIVAGLVTS